MQYTNLNLKEKTTEVLKKLSESVLGNMEYREKILGSFQVKKDEQQVKKDEQEAFFQKYKKSNMLCYSFDFPKKGVVIKELEGEKGWKRVTVTFRKNGSSKQIISFFDELNNSIVEFFIESTPKAFVESLINNSLSEQIIPKDYIVTRIEVILQDKKVFSYEEYRTFLDNKLFLEKYSPERMNPSEILFDSSSIDNSYKQFIYDMLLSASLGSDIEIAYQNGYPIYTQMSGIGNLNYIGNNACVTKKNKQVITWLNNLNDEIIESIYQTIPQTNPKKYIKKNPDK